MSRIGKKPINLPEKVEIVSGADGVVTVKGPRGSLDCKLSSIVTMKQEEKQLIFKLSDSCNPNSPQAKADYGTSRSLIDNCIVGVTEGWKKTLELHGVGYNAKLAGKELTLNVGYSHQVKFTIPDGIDCKIEKNTTILLESNDKQLIGNMAAKIYKSCPPEPYLGKGIRYQGQQVRRKAGKAGAK